MILNTTAQADIHAVLHDAYVDVVAHFQADNTGATDTGARLQAAYASGKRLFWPEGVYKSSLTLTMPDGAHWEGAAPREKDASSGGVKLLYTGTGTAIKVTGNNNARLENFQVACTTAGAVGLELADPAQWFQAQNCVFIGPGSGSGIGLLMHGQASCVCSNTFIGCHWQSWDDALRLSGYANANQFINSTLAICATGINLSKYGADTQAGNDNIFERFELNGSTTKGITLADSASRNVFLKAQCDGVTIGYSIASSCAKNTFINSAIAIGGGTDSSSTTVYINCDVGGGANIGGTLEVLSYLYTDVEAYIRNGQTQQVKLGYVGGAPGLTLGTAEDTNLYRAAANQLKSDDIIIGADGVATKTKAGTPVDGDFATTPPIGTIVVDTTANKIWVRTAAATWKGVVVA